MKRLAAYYFLYYLALSVYGPYQSLYFSEKGFSGTATGLILSLWALAGVISQPVMGMINDRLHDPLRLLKISAVLSPVIGLGFYYFHSYGVLALVAVLFSWFQSSSAPLGDAIAVEIGNRQGYSFASIRLWGALSYAIGAFATGFLYEKTGYSAGFWYFFAISIPVYLSLATFTKTTVVRHRTSVWEQVGLVVRNRPFMVFVGIGLMFSMAISINMSFLPFYFKQMGFDLRMVGVSSSIAALTEVPMFWLSATFVRRFGRFPMLAAGTACFALKCLLLVLFHNLYLTLALQTLDGISFAIFAGISVEAVESFAGEKTKATLQTVFSAVTFGLGGIVGNAAGGVVIDKLGAPALYLLLFALSVGSAVLYMTVTSVRTSKPTAEIALPE